MTFVERGSSAVWLGEADCRIDDFIAVVDTTTRPAEYPHAASIDDNVVIYDGDQLRAGFGDPDARRDVQAEFNHAFLDGPGVIAVRRAFADTDVIDAATVAFTAIIDRQQADGLVSGDHYAKPGDNDRVWNALEKLAVENPDLFVAYYANDIIAAASAAWLGPGYTLTSQINVVNPGGPAQSPHRDYHLGFTTIATAELYPAHIHRLSAALTLQGAIAHCDMPVETGPTMYLPHSQKYLFGYVAWRLPEFRDYFEQHRVQLALAKGDAVFFNPAVFHAAGTNRTTDVHRMANLLQINSPLGKALEAIDHERMCNAVYPALMAFKARGASAAEVDNAITASADCYPFPTTLDRDPPIGGLTPPSQADVLRRALAEAWTNEALARELAAYANRRRTA